VATICRARGLSGALFRIGTLAISRSGVALISNSRSEHSALTPPGDCNCHKTDEVLVIAGAADRGLSASVLCVIETQQVALPKSSRKRTLTASENS
jgi:hypothetical protein